MATAPPSCVSLRLMRSQVPPGRQMSPAHPSSGSRASTSGRQAPAGAARAGNNLIRRGFATTTAPAASTTSTPSRDVPIASASRTCATRRNETSCAIMVAILARITSMAASSAPSSSRPRVRCAGMLAAHSPAAMRRAAAQAARTGPMIWRDSSTATRADTSTSTTVATPSTSRLWTISAFAACRCRNPSPEVRFTSCSTPSFTCAAWRSSAPQATGGPGWVPIASMKAASAAVAWPAATRASDDNERSAAMRKSSCTCTASAPIDGSAGVPVACCRAMAASSAAKSAAAARA